MSTAPNVNNSKGKVIDDPNKLMIKAWRRTSLPYKELESALKSGNAYFVAGLKRQTAHSAAQRLSRKIRKKVVVHKARYEQEEGYAFFAGGLDQWVKRGTKEGWLKEEQ